MTKNTPKNSGDDLSKSALKSVLKNQHGSGVAVAKNNGFKIQSWRDVVAFATVLILCLSGLAWGLKLEYELNTMRNQHNQRLVDLEAKVGEGILPRAEERIAENRRRIERLESEN